MKPKEARRTLEYALENQKTISINKLTSIFNALSINLKYQDSKVREVEYLKGEIKKLSKENRRLKRTCKCEL